MQSTSNHHAKRCETSVLHKNLQRNSENVVCSMRLGNLFFPQVGTQQVWAQNQSPSTSKGCANSSILAYKFLP